jgi:hypothetical protein
MDLGFIHSAHLGSGLFAGYTVPFLESAVASRIAAGGIGIVAVLAVALVAGRSMQKRS